jgi:DNA-binding MarR family transcriptional regulator
MSTKEALKRRISEEEAVRLRGAVMRLSRELRKTAAEEGLTATQSSVLATVVRSNEMALSELAGWEGLNPTMLSRVIGHLESLGLVLRLPNSTDRRSAKVRATAQGKKLVHRLRNRRTAELLKRAEQLNSHQVDLVLDALPALEALAGLTSPQNEGTSV